EYVMISLRTIRGTNLHEIGNRFGPEFENHFRHLAIRHLASGHLTENSGIYTLNRKGKFLADGIAADIFIEA
ncbi:MAG: coproporphyrinogen III oxidase, partial [Bacteroidia bacterium]|nr:coproporphyrinogen III oxidase [Bacteroidia bacterium]